MGVLIKPVYNQDGNFNREGKRVRAEYIGKICGCDAYTKKDKYGHPNLYYMTISGYAVFWGGLELNYGEQELARREQQIGKLFAIANEKVSAALADPDSWCEYAAAAMTNRIKEAEAHNAPIRERKRVEREQKLAAKVAAEEAEKAEQKNRLNGAMDAIAYTLAHDEYVDLKATEYSMDAFITLLKAHNIDLVPATLGWMRKKLCGVKFEGKSSQTWAYGKTTDTFWQAIRRLNYALRLKNAEQEEQI